MTRRFVHYQLRTTDRTAARSFYTALFGADFFGEAISTTPLPERARSRGAPPHWLGQLATPNLAAVARRMVADGGQLLGPAGPTVDDAIPVSLRDPFGAVLALVPEADPPAPEPVAWHLLHARDEEAAFALYAELFDWEGTDVLDLGPELGRHRIFSWDAAGRPVGGIANTACPPAIHPQWLFYFPVDDLGATLARVRALGGLVVSPNDHPTG
ncbi:MAG: hypothetical protein AB7R55_23700, partial [Gemmatimonadales bacterium]